MRIWQNERHLRRRNNLRWPQNEHYFRWPWKNIAQIRHLARWCLPRLSSQSPGLPRFVLVPLHLNSCDTQGVTPVAWRLWHGLPFASVDLFSLYQVCLPLKLTPLCDCTSFLSGLCSVYVTCSLEDHLMGTGLSKQALGVCVAVTKPLKLLPECNSCSCADDQHAGYMGVLGIVSVV